MGLAVLPLTQVPELRDLGGGQQVACHFPLTPEATLLQRAEELGRDVVVAEVDRDSR
jgi:hypothetical protein